MKLYLIKFINLIILSAGGRPDVVYALRVALARSSKGQSELIYAQNTRRGSISPNAVRILLYVVGALFSIFLAVFFIVDTSELRPSVAILILVAVHYLAVLNMVAATAGPGLLADDDTLTIGWWPITQREILLARVGVLLKPGLEITAATMTLPLIAMAITGHPPVLGAILLAIGLLLQTVGVTFGIAVLITLLVRLLGRRKAQRISGVFADGNYWPALIAIQMFTDGILAFIKAHTWILNLLPPTWFAAWGDPSAGTATLLRALLGLVFVVGTIVWGSRLAATTNSAAAKISTERTTQKWHLSKLICWFMRPWFRSREGKVILLLLEAHIREDWRFLSTMLMLPVAFGVMFFVMDPYVGATEDPVDLSFSAFMAIKFSYFPLMMSAGILFSASYSSLAKALWIVAIGNLDSGKLLTAQRFMVHGLMTTPVVILYCVRAWQLGASWQVILADGLLYGLEFELILLLLQPAMMTMPFSQAYVQDELGRRIVHGLVALAVTIGFVLANAFYAEAEIGRYIIWPIVLVLWPLLLKLLSYRTRGKRLRMAVLLDNPC